MNTILKLSTASIFALCFSSQNIFCDPADKLIEDLSIHYQKWCDLEKKGTIGFPFSSERRDWPSYEIPKEADFLSFVLEKTQATHFSYPLLGNDFLKSKDPAVHKFIYDYFYYELRVGISKEEIEFLSNWLVHIDEPTRRLVARKLFAVSPHQWMNEWYQVQRNIGLPLIGWGVIEVIYSKLFGSNLTPEISSLIQSLHPVVQSEIGVVLLVSMGTAGLAIFRRTVEGLGMRPFGPPGRSFEFFKKAVAIRDPGIREQFIQENTQPNVCAGALIRLSQTRK